MIKIKISDNRIILSGHANSNSDIKEYDLVCCAVSTLTECFKLQYPDQVIDDDVDCELIRDFQEDIYHSFEFVRRSLKILSKMFSEFIEVEEE